MFLLYVRFFYCWIMFEIDISRSFDHAHYFTHFNIFQIITSTQIRFLYIAFFSLLRILHFNLRKHLPTLFTKRTKNPSQNTHTSTTICVSCIRIYKLPLFVAFHFQPTTLPNHNQPPQCAHKQSTRKSTTIISCVCVDLVCPLKGSLAGFSCNILAISSCSFS